jgi:hypothetical protein
MDQDNDLMNKIDPNIFLRIGQSLIQEDQNEIYDYVKPKKTFQEYKSAYLQKLHEQIESLIEKREKLLKEYNLCLNFNKISIEKITYYNKKLGTSNHNYKNHSTATFMSLRTTHLKQILNETIANNILNSKKLYELEKEIKFTDFCIYKTKGYIKLNI